MGGADIILGAVRKERELVDVETFHSGSSSTMRHKPLSGFIVLLVLDPSGTASSHDQRGKYLCQYLDNSV